MSKALSVELSCKRTGLIIRILCISFLFCSLNVAGLNLTWIMRRTQPSSVGQATGKLVVYHGHAVKSLQV